MKDNRIRYLIFDFFGTLVGYTPGTFSGDKYRKTHQFLTANKYSISYQEFVENFSGIFSQLEEKAKITHEEFHMYELGRIFFTSNFGHVSTTILEEFTEIYISEWNNGVRFYPGIRSFIKRLQEKYALVIISNTHYPSLITRNLASMGISDYFTLITTSVEYGIRKPDTRIFHETLRKLAAPTASVMYIGDNLHDDYEGSRNAGIPCILIDPAKKFQGTIADRVDTLFDIEKLL